MEGMSRIQELYNIWRKKLSSKLGGDKALWGSMAFLSILSILVVYSATGKLAIVEKRGNTEYYLYKQIISVLIGFALIYFLHKRNYKHIYRWVFPVYIASLFLLLYTLFFGATINQATRWVYIPFTSQTFQTSDFAKLALYMQLAAMLSQMQKNDIVKDFKKGFLRLLIPIFLTVLLILPENFSDAMLTGLTSLLLLFIGRVRIKHLLGIIAVGLIPISFLLGYAMITHSTNQAAEGDNVEIMHTSTTTTAEKKSNKTSRFSTWVNRVQDFLYAKDDDVPFQVRQARIAIANGNIFWGVGVGNSEQRNNLSQAYNDFIYCIIIEEYGIVAAFFILITYFIFLHRCIVIFKKCPGAFGAFLALGLGFTFSIQALSNMAVAVGIVPVTGVALPLISMGGTSYLFACVSVGLLLSISRYVEENEKNSKEI